MQPTHYTFLPKVYDRWQKSYGRDYTTLIFPRLITSLRRYNIRPGSGLDLACGTGTLALLMAKRGWRMIGVDASPGMIEAARGKAAGGRTDVTFLQDDMRKFTVPGNVDLVTCLYDSLNHLRTLRDLTATFKRVHRCLAPGGHFIFDVNNEHCFRTLWRQKQEIDEPDFEMVLDNSYNIYTRLARTRVVVTMKADPPEQFIETVFERCFPPKAIAGALKQAGFNLVEHTDFNFTKLRRIGKIKTWWVAQKEA